MMKSLVCVLFGSFCLTNSALAQCTNEQKLTASDAAYSDYFGWSVSVSGDTAIVGAYQDDDAGSKSGSAYVFRINGDAWVEEQKLTASDAAAVDYFGRSVSVSGDTVVVGAYADDDAGNSSGSAYVFRFDGTSWFQEQKLTASDAGAYDYFGYSVSVSGNTVIVGAYGNDDAGPYSGSAYIFRFDGMSWVEEQKLTAPAAGAYDYFGYSVSVSGDTAVVGAYDPSYSGYAYVFRFDGTSWVEEQKLNASDADFGDWFGYSVSVSGDTAVVGAYRDDDPGSDSGSAYVFRFNGTSWVEEQKLTALDAASGDEFGESVSVSGDTVVVGAYLDDDNAGESGSAYVFRFDGANWVEEEKLTASDASTGARFGRVSVSGNTVVVGAYLDGSGSGSAYVFLTWPETCIDIDCDGYGSPGDPSCPNGITEDCNDTDSAVFPGNIEIICNGIDDDCDSATLDVQDSDNDGIDVCSDCNDGDPNVFPGNDETICNGIDDDCDPGTPDDPDGDGDGVGICTDCNDSDPDIYPGNSETTCNGIDDDCDPVTSDAPGGVDFDCNANGLPDECDLVDGTSNDCNDNSLPDECDLAEGFSSDNNGNGIPDECDCEDDSDCDNGIFCDGAETCLGAGTPAVVCVSGGIPCGIGEVCDEGNDVCTGNGACCFSASACLDYLDLEACLEIDGSFMGHDSLCSDDADMDGVTDCLDTCPTTPPGMTVDEFGCALFGACCFAVGVCVDEAPPGVCRFVGGVYQGNESECVDGCLFGDYDGDRDVDTDDFSHWPSCASGPGIGYTLNCTTFDFDGDQDVDLKDFAAFARSFSH